MQLPENKISNAWLKSSFENFHELDHDVLAKLKECWWKVNTHENAPFARWENHGQGPYANAKTEKDYDPYLDINRIFGRNYRSKMPDLAAKKSTMLVKYRSSGILYVFVVPF
ncbi:hypothetical protein Tco_0361423 [Tanacetum coccineum]